MEDTNKFEEYFQDTETEEDIETVQESGSAEPVTIEKISELTAELSGTDAMGVRKSVAVYMTYDLENGEMMGYIEPSVVGEVRTELSVDRLTGFYSLDLYFEDSEDANLLALWGSLFDCRQKQIYETDTNWVSHFKLTQVVENMDQGTDVLTAELINPLIYSITREKPDQKVSEFEFQENMLFGGNIIRMVFHPNTVTFQYERVEREYLDEDEE